MRLQGGIALGDKSPSRIDAFVKTLEEDRDYYKRELEYLQKIVKRRLSPLQKSPEKVFVFVNYSFFNTSSSPPKLRNIKFSQVLTASCQFNFIQKWLPWLKGL